MANENGPGSTASRVPNDVDWNLVRAFLAVLESGSLTAAARALATTQPTLGRRIESFEAQVGKVLFERTGRGLEPTAAALRFSEHARRMQGNADALARAISAGSGPARPLVRVAASRQVALHMLPEMLRDAPGLLSELDVGIVPSDQVSNLLRRDADIAIRNVRPQQTSLIAKKVGEVRVRAYASTGYLACKGTPSSAAELLEHDLVGGDRDPAFARAIDMAAQACGIDGLSIRIAVRSDDYATQFAAVRAGHGIGFSLDALIERHDELAMLDVELGLPRVPFWLAVHRELRTAPAIRRVFDALAVGLREALR